MERELQMELSVIKKEDEKYINTYTDNEIKARFDYNKCKCFIVEEDTDLKLKQQRVLLLQN